MIFSVGERYFPLGIWKQTINKESGNCYKAWLTKGMVLMCCLLVRFILCLSKKRCLLLQLLAFSSSILPNNLYNFYSQLSFIKFCYDSFRLDGGGWLTLWSPSAIPSCLLFTAAAQTSWGHIWRNSPQRGSGHVKKWTWYQFPWKEGSPLGCLSFPWQDHWPFAHDDQQCFCGGML